MQLTPSVIQPCSPVSKASSVRACSAHGLILAVAVGWASLNAVPGLAEYTGSHCITDGISCDRACPKIEPQDPVYPPCWQACNKVVRECLTAAEARQKIDRAKQQCSTLS